MERNLKYGKNLWEVGEQRLGSEIPKVLEMEINYCIPLHSIMTSRKKKKKQYEGVITESTRYKVWEVYSS